MILEAENYFALDFNFEGFYQIQLNLANPTTRRTELKQIFSVIPAHPLAMGNQKVIPQPFPPL